MSIPTDSCRHASSSVARVRSTPRSLRPRLARLSIAREGGPGVSLDDLIVETVEDLAVRERARCLVCNGELLASGHCPDCHSSLN